METEDLLKLLEENIREIAQEIGTGNDFLARTPKEQETYKN
jgi:hypothetical protein